MVDMSQMSPPMGGDRGMGPTAGQVMEQSRSAFNPVDAAAMQQNPIDPNTTTVRQFFQAKGIDVDGPLVQLVDYAKNQIQNSSMAEKTKAMAGAAPEPNPMEQKMAGGAPPGNAMDALMASGG